MMRTATLCMSMLLLLASCNGLSPNMPKTTNANAACQTRRNIFVSGLTFAAAATCLPSDANAAVDCFKDCLKNCKLIAPKDTAYCTTQCTEYCNQDDRNDGLSGSVSSSGGEVGILGGTFGQGTVPKGEDKPPSFSMPGLDFSSDKGRKLLGYGS
eukprot:CAMPEP_0198135568 /NCGR_PEP_ID=MMETSP1442-20131203/60657_1 /TAXON_ID= /ORGANISM="Craspedostauros australis, Strain CCMP3328" /LENGTH=154 /DNA_ID=CAMNT_0043796741 /DNA_START=28 /DNA_END=492 /DNA_ORIENTATION=-